MKQNKHNKIPDEVLTNKINSWEYPKGTNEKLIISWYKVNIESATDLLSGDDLHAYLLERAEEFDDTWIKLIVEEEVNTLTSKSIDYRYRVTLRPYRQGYGCDGTTDRNIHAIAKKLANRNGLNYYHLLRLAYPNDYTTDEKFDWLKDDEYILSETIIPDLIDPEMALRDLEQINNYSLAMEFGIALYKVGGTTVNWIQKREDLERFKKEADLMVQKYWANQFKKNKQH